MIFLFRFILIITTFSVQILHSQDKYVINSSGDITLSDEFTVLSNVGEPITSVSDHVENGFLLKNSLDKLYKEDFLVIYPNPSSEGFFIEVGLSSEIIIYSELGQLVYSESLEKGLNYISLLTFSKGLYFIQLHNNQLSIKGYKLLKM